MKALTIRPQWAHAIAWHGKRIENRTRPFPRTLRVDERFAIHAGREPGRDPWWEQVLDASGGSVRQDAKPTPVLPWRGRPSRASISWRLQCRGKRREAA